MEGFPEAACKRDDVAAFGGGEVTSVAPSVRGPDFFAKRRMCAKRPRRIGNPQRTQNCLQVHTKIAPDYIAQ